MTIKKKLLIEIELTSGASEAGLSCHLNDICSGIRNYAEGIKLNPCNNEIYTNLDWKTSLPVEIQIAISEPLE